MFPWRPTTRDIVISALGSAVTALIIAGGVAIWQVVATGGLISILGGVTKDELGQTNRRVSKLEIHKMVVPLPSPISLGGGSRFTSSLSLGPSVPWTPLPGHDEVEVDWRSLPDDIDVYAEVFVQVRTNMSGPAIYGQIRLFNISERQVAATFERVRATRDGTDTSLESRLVPRRDGVRTYRLEVSGDRYVSMGGYGYLRFRRQEDS